MFDITHRYRVVSDRPMWHDGPTNLKPARNFDKGDILVSARYSAGTPGGEARTDSDGDYYMVQEADLNDTNLGGKYIQATDVVLIGSDADQESPDNLTLNIYGYYAEAAERLGLDAEFVRIHNVASALHTLATNLPKES